MGEVFRSPEKPSLKRQGFEEPGDRELSTPGRDYFLRQSVCLSYGACRNLLFQGNKNDIFIPSYEETHISSCVQVKGKEKGTPSGSCVVPSAESRDFQREKK